MADTNLRVRLQHAYKTEAEWEATTTIPKAGEILLTKDGLHKNWRKTGDGVHRWSELEYDKPTYDQSEIQPIKSKHFSNVTCTANNDPNGYLYFATIRPTSYNSQWRVTYKVTATINNQVSGYQYSEVTIDGKLNTYSAYRTYNAILNTNYRPLYSHLLHSTSETGFNNEYPHLLGVRLYSSWNPSVAANSREILIEIMEVKNCTLTFLDSMTVFANMPGATTTNYGNASSGAYATRVNFDGTTQGITISGDRNTYPYFDSLYYTKPLAGTNGIKQYSLIMEDSDGKYQSFTTDYGTGTSKTKNPSGFKLGKIYYASTSSNYAANAQYGNDVTRSFQYAVDARYSFNCGQTLTAYTPLYLVGTYNPTTNLFYLDNTWYTQALPTEEDGKIYIYLGLPYNTYQFDFVGYSTPLYYKDGAMRPFVAPEATPALSGLMSSSDKEKLDIYTMAETTVPGGQGKAIGWYRIAKISIMPDKAYANFTLYTNGVWSTGAPTIGVFQLSVQNTNTNIVQLSGRLGTIFTKIRLVRDGSTSNHFVDLYQGTAYTSSQSMGTQYFTFIGQGNVETYQPETPLTEEATASSELEIKTGVVSANFYGNLTGTATTATTANRVSGVAGATNADRHVWFSDSATETARNYDDDFKYNPNTNTLKVSKIDGTQLTGTPTAPTAANGTNTTQIATTAFVQNAIGNTEIGGRNLVLNSNEQKNSKNTITTYNLSSYGINKLLPKTKCVISLDVKGSVADKCDVYIRSASQSSLNGTCIIDATTDFQRFSFPIQLNNYASSSPQWLAIRTTSAGSGGTGTTTFTIQNVKVEIGEKATDWTLAPEDAVSSLSVSGQTVSYNNYLGAPLGTITTQDTTYSAATSSKLGLVKSGTDISVDSSGNVSVLDNSHNHTIANVTNLQTALDAKAPLASPALTGTPTAPTATSGTNTTQIATTAFVQNAIGNATIGGRNLIIDKDCVRGKYLNNTGAEVNSARNISSDYIEASPNESFVLQIWYHDFNTSLTNDQRFWTPRILYYNSNKQYISGYTTTYPNAEYYKFVGTAPAETAYVRTCLQLEQGKTVAEWHNGNDNIYWKLERGNKPTDWTPASEDLVSNISLSGTTLSYSNPIGTQLGSYTLSKSNVGLGNVDNTSDANKPISTATQTALDQIANTIGNAKLFTGTCSTAAGTAEKAVTCSSFKAADLVVGNQISVLFSNTNSASAADLKLNVNGTGAKSIKYVYNDSYSNLPGVGYLKADQIYRFIYDGTYWVIDMMYNTNTTPAYLEYRNNTYAKKALTAESLIVGDKDGYEKVAANVVFDLSYPILWCTAAVAQGGNNYANMFLQHYDRNIGYIKSGYTSSAKKMIYLVVTISGNSATVDSSIITDTLPSTDDGKAYITLGRLGQQSTGANYFLFQTTHPIFVFRKGALRLYSGSADVVNGHTVETDVPSGAVFTDSKVTQTLSSANSSQPLLMSIAGTGNTTTDVTNTVIRNNLIYANPSTGILTAPYLKSTHYLQAQNKVYGVASSVNTQRVIEAILYTGIEVKSGSYMPEIHISGYAYGIYAPIDLRVVFYVYDNKICNQGVVDNGGWHPDVYIFKYTSNSKEYIAIALKVETPLYYPTFHADILNNAQTKLDNFNLSMFNWQFVLQDGTSVIPAVDNGVTCIQALYKVNSNPKPKLTFQMAGTDSAAYDGTGTATFNVTKSGIGLGNVENKSSATIRGELTASNVTTALGYTPANVTALNGYIPYGGNDNGLGSGTTAEKAKEYFADATKIPNGKVKFYYNNSGNEYTTIFSKAPNASYGSVIKWGYSDKYFRILRYSASNWATDDWEKMDAGYADSAGYALSIANSALSAENVDTFIENGRLKWGKIGTYDIGWGGKDGFIISIPWSANFARQIAYDDQSTWTATRAMNNGTWSDWDRIVTKTYGDTLYIPKGGPVNSDLYTNSLDGAKTILCKNSLVTTSTSLVGDANTNLTTSTNISEWLKALLKQICIEYPNYTNTTFRGWITPSSSGYYEVFIYNTNNIDSTTGLPQYSYGTFRQYVNTYVVFSTNSYTYSQESLVTHSNWTNWITTSSIGAIPLTGSTAITGHLITRGTGEVQIGVGYTTENTARKLYLWGNNSSGSRGLYDDKRGYVINVTDSGVTFTGALSGNATTATNLTTLKSTLATSLGSIDSFTTNTHGYVTGLTAANWNYQRSDGAMYGQFYSATWQHQIYGDYRTGQISIRGKNNGTWQDWRRVLDESNYNTIIDANKLAITVTDLSFGTKGLSGTLDPITAYNIGPSASNKTFGLPAEAITVEYSTDAGTTWQDYGLSDYSKKALFAETREQWIYAGKNSTSGQGSTNYWLRVTIYPSDGRYAYINGLYLWVNRAGVTATVDLQRSTRGNPDVFTEVFSGQDIAGWSGNNIRYFSSNSFGGGTDQTSNGYKYRMIFKITSITNANYGTLSVSDIRFLGSSVFSFPSGNYMMKHNRLYNWDADLNATFPAKLIASIIQAPVIQTGTDSTSYFQSQKFRGQGDANTYYHAIDFGYTGHNQVDFYEYGGIYNFWKNTESGTSSAILLGKITTNGWEGNVVGHASLDLPLTGGQLTGDLTLYSASGNSPAIMFQRGTDSDTLTDWKIIDSSGNLLFQCRDSSATNNAWTTKFTLGYNGVLTATSFTGSVTGHASLDLPLTAGSGSPLSNSLYITKAGECGVEVNNTQTTNPNQVAFIVGSSGNGGIYSRKHNKWIVYANASGDVVLNGNATSATTATTATTATYLNIVAGNELRFASKPSSAVTLYVGYKWHDGTSDAKINRYKFCNGNAALAEVEASTFYGSLSGNATTATTANEAKALITLGDKRSVATTPNDYTNKIVFAGLKAKATMNNPSSDIYSYVIGLRGWSDSSGGKAYEFALNNSGINYRLENTSTTWNDWNAIAHAPNGGVGSTSQPVYMDTDGTLKVTNLKLDDIAPMATKTYTGLYGSANDAAGASFYFMTVKPTTYYTIWKIKYRVHCWVPNKNYYDSYADVEIWGYQSTYSSYKIFNAHSYEGSTIRRPFYFHNLYRATQAGSSAYGHAIGLGLRAGSEPTNSAYPRTFTVELLDTENCTATLFDDAVKYANLPGTGSTNYSALTEFDGYNVGLRETSDDNDTTTVRDYYEHLTAGTNGMKQYSLVMEDADGKWQSFTTTHGTATDKAKNTVGFRLGKIFYLNLSGNIAANAKNGDNVVTSHMTNLNFQYSSNCGSTLTADKPLFIKGTYNHQTGLFYLANTWWAQDFPTSEDGFIYIQIGFARSTTNYDFNNTLPTYWYKDGVVREFIPEATINAAGLMSNEDKITLNAIPSTYLAKSGGEMTGSLSFADSTEIQFFKTFDDGNLNGEVEVGAIHLSSNDSLTLSSTYGITLQPNIASLSADRAYLKVDGSAKITDTLEVNNQIYVPNSTNVGSSLSITTLSSAAQLSYINSSDTNADGTIIEFTSSDINVACNNMEVNGTLSVTDGLKDAHSVTSYTADNVSVASSTVVALKTISLTAGKYLVIYGGQFASNSSGYRCLFFTNSGDTLSNLGGRYGIRTPAVSGSITVMNGAQILKPTGTTTYGLYAYQTSGATLASYGFFHIIRL